MNKPKIELVDIATLVPYEKNVKIHDDKQVERIAKSITEFGWDQPIVVDAAGVIIKGHGRRLAALKLGLTKVPVWVRDDLSPAQVRASRLADNRVAQGGTDTELLSQELADLDFDLVGIFDARELNFMSVGTDLGAINEDAFVEDIDLEVRRQAAETAGNVDDADSKEVSIAKVLGFKSVKVRDERVLARFMATIEAETGEDPASALVTIAKRHLETA